MKEKTEKNSAAENVRTIRNVRQREDNSKRLTGALRGTGFYLFAAVAGLLLSRAPILDDYAPFGIALCAALPGSFSIAAAGGAVLGFLLPGAGAESLRYIIAIFTSAALKWVLSNLFKFRRSAAASSVIALLAAVSTGAAVLGTQGGGTSEYIGCAVESLLACGAAYFICRAISAVRDRRRGEVFSSHELTAVIITAAVVLLSLTPLEIAGVSFARVLTIIAILAAARYGNESAGAIAGVAAGFVMSMTSESLIFIAGSYALGGLIAGVFSPLGRIGCAAAFAISNAIISMRAGVSGEVIVGLYEVMAATVIFLVIPEKWVRKLAGFMSPAAELPRVNGLRRSVVTRLKFAATALSEVSKTVEEVSSRLSRIHSPEFEDVFRRVENEACKHCNMRAFCWEAERAATLSMLMYLIKKIRADGHVEPGDVPEAFVAECSHLPEVISSLIHNYTDYSVKIQAERRIKEVRSVVSDQFDGVSEMFYDMAEEFEKAEKYDIESAEKIAEALRAQGVIAQDVGCCIDKFGRMTVEVRCGHSESRGVSRAELTKDISGAVGKKFDPPCISRAGGEVYMILTEKTGLRADFGAAQYAMDETRMCGDAYDYFNDGKGRALMIISDGMGTGGRAAVDGAMASGLMSRLIRAGFGFECSLKIVNSAMLFKSTDESLATLDIACIDYFTGETEILKAGAPPAVLRRSGKTGIAECSSLPAGILRDIGFERSNTALAEGDIIVMLSDGAIAEGVEWIREELEKWEDGSAQQLADHIAEMAQRRRAANREDDITVLAAILEKNK
ncbi:MAG TPA: stage II sporulation protein E [Ruminococcaceae bacterium]|nr:stage II sporulation protein E [Oscillospiraceae bacterium]